MLIATTLKSQGNLLILLIDNSKKVHLTGYMKVVKNMKRKNSQQNHTTESFLFCPLTNNYMGK